MHVRTYVHTTYMQSTSHKTISYICSSKRAKQPTFACCSLLTHLDEAVFCGDDGAEQVGKELRVEKDGVSKLLVLKVHNCALKMRRD